MGAGLGCAPTGQTVQETFEAAPEYDFSAERAIERLSGAITHKTISYRDSTLFNPIAYESFIRYLEGQYPRMHESLEQERIGNYSLLFRWEGKNTELNPALVMGHYDVVPVEEQSVADWTYPPFSGEVVDGFIWGRGALDDKSGIFSIMEAIEYLLESGFQPPRTLYFAFHHDEEIGGRQGALQVAEHLKAQDIELEYLVDEGLPIAVDITDDVDVPLAMIGVAEKGAVSIELSYRRDGGHSSMPPRETVIGTLSRAVNQLENNNMQGEFSGLLEETFKPVVPHMKFSNRLAFNNLWLFRGSIERRLSKEAPTNAALRTTTAKTIFDSGIKENVLPATGRVIVNFRIHPNDTIEDVVEHVQRTITNPDIKIEVLEGARNPSPVSDTDSPYFSMLQRTIKETFDNIPVSPSLFVAASDSRHYHDLTANVYRFRPIRAEKEDQSRVHGVDERLSVENYLEMVRYQIRLIENTPGD